MASFPSLAGPLSASRTLCALAGSVFLLGCPSSAPSETASTQQDLAAAPSDAVRVEARLVADGEALSCSAAGSLDGETLTLFDAGVFFSAPRWVLADGSTSEARFVADGAFQQPEVALVDFAPREGDCSNATPAAHQEVTLEAPPEGVRALRVDLGVPFALNHLDPGEAAPPLDSVAMHWSWRAGYKFVKFDARWGERQVRVHLGSTDCEGPMDAIASCARPCRAMVDIPWDPEGMVWTLDVAPWLRANASEERITCMAEPDTPACVPVLEALGLDAATCTPPA